ncbi:MAG: hypothetical protein U9N63_15735 [Pseudomonadota bacterium]|nr:hypothetical protein [Pseudomonadota bacterium]
MTHVDEVEGYVKEPNLLVELCQEVIETLNSEAKYVEKSAMQAQLREISRAINMLDKQGVPIPDALRAEKTRLAAADEISNDSSQGLILLLNGLNAILSKYSGVTNKKKSLVPITKDHIKKASTGEQTPQSELIPYLLESLKELDGEANCNEVLALMEQKLSGKLLPGDLEPDSGFKIKWRHNAHWARLKLANDGILKKNSPRGIWQFSEDHR